MNSERKFNTAGAQERIGRVYLQPRTLKTLEQPCRTPHSIELRRDAAGLYVEARTEVRRHIVTVGAKTVEQIFHENGAEIPAADTTETEIVFSPYTGAVTVIRPKKPAAEKPAEF